MEKYLSIIKILLVLTPLATLMFASDPRGWYFLIYFVYLLILLALQNIFIHKIPFHKINFSFDVEALIALAVIMVFVSLVDFSVVETFKKLPDFPYNSTYWRNLFNIFLPILWVVMGFMFHLGGGRVGATLKIIIAGFYVEYSALNDFLYYLLNGERLPDKWTWIQAPQFIFGYSITTGQLALWLIIMLIFTFIILLLPLDSFIKDNIFQKNKITQTIDKHNNI